MGRDRYRPWNTKSGPLSGCCVQWPLTSVKSFRYCISYWDISPFWYLP